MIKIPHRGQQGRAIFPGIGKPTFPQLSVPIKVLVSS